MNTVNAHLNEESIKINLGKIETDFSDSKYRALRIGNGLMLFMNESQIEALFIELDEKLHVQTETSEYMRERIDELENKVIDLEELVEAEQENEEPLVEFDGEHDFYQVM